MADPAFVGEFDTILREYAGVPSLLYDAERLSRAGRRPDPAQARGPQPHRRPQDPQRARPGAADPADGQDPGDRRDRRRPARRRQRHRGGVLRPRLHRLHGRGRHPAPGAQRRPDAPARRQGGRRSTPAAPRSRTPSTRRMRDWVASVDHTAYLFGTAAGPHPFPSMVRDFTRGIGDEARAAVPRADRRAARRDRGLRRRRLQRDRAVHRVPRRRGRRDLRLRARRRRRRHRRGTRPRSTPATRGVLHGARTYVLQDEDGQTIESHSISAGLDYPGVGPQHAHLAADRPGDVPAGHRRRGDGRDGAAEPHRGHHPGHRVRARGRRRARRGRAARPRRRGPTRPCSSTSRGRGDKDMGTAIEWFGLGDPDEATEEPVGEPGEEPIGQDAGSQRVSARPPSTRRAPSGRAALVGYLPAGFPDVAGGIEALRGDGRRRLRRDRGRPALQRPGDGRPHHPGRRPAGPRRRRPHHRRAAHGRGGRRHRRADAW